MDHAGETPLVARPRAIGAHAAAVLRALELPLLAAALVFVFVARMPALPFHPDESQWIASSEAWDVFARGERGSPIWSATLWTRTQPPGARFVIGIGRSIGGYGSEQLNKAWMFALSREQNIAAGAIPEVGLLWWSRLPMAMLGAASCLLSFVMLRRWFNAPAAYVAVLLLASNAWFGQLLGRAMAEAGLLFCVLLVSAAAMELTGRPPGRRRWLWLLLIGLAGGLAASIKPSGVLALCGAAAVWVLVGALAERRRGIRGRVLRSALGVAALAVVAAAVVWALNPYLDVAPLERTAGLFTYRAVEFDKQIAANPGWAVGGIADRLAFWYRYVFEATTLPGVPAVSAAAAVLSAVGLGAVLAAVFSGLRRRRLVPAGALLTTAVAAAGPMLLTPLNWDRYMLLPAWYGVLLCAIGLSASLRAAAARSTRRRNGAR